MPRLSQTFVTLTLRDDRGEEQDYAACVDGKVFLRGQEGPAEVYDLCVTIPDDTAPNKVRDVTHKLDAGWVAFCEEKLILQEQGYE